MHLNYICPGTLKTVPSKQKASGPATPAKPSCPTCPVRSSLTSSFILMQDWIIWSYPWVELLYRTLAAMIVQLIRLTWMPRSRYLLKTVCILERKFANEIVSLMLFVGRISFSRHSHCSQQAKIWACRWSPLIEQRNFSRTHNHLVIMRSTSELHTAMVEESRWSNIWKRYWLLRLYHTSTDNVITSSIFDFIPLISSWEELLNTVVVSCRITMLSIHCARDLPPFQRHTQCL